MNSPIGMPGGPPTLTGHRTVLRPTAADDQAALVAIRLTPEVQRRWRGQDLNAEFAESLADDESVQLTICTPEGVIVGLIQFAEETDPEYRHAGLDIYLDPAAHGQGFGSDAIRTLANHLFDEVGHHRLTIDPASDNVEAIRCYTAVGFRPVGLMRRYERQSDGTWGDGLLMDLLSDQRT